MGRISEVVPKDNDTIELKMSFNGKLVKVILDTGSPISIIPSSLTAWLKPKTRKKPPPNRQFVDLNDNEVAVTEILELETKLNEKTLILDWWEVQTDTRPTLGMDNFSKLELRIFQGKEATIGSLRKYNEIKKYKKQLAENFGELFARQGTIRNFKYGLKFKDNFEIFEEKRSR